MARNAENDPAITKGWPNTKRWSNTLNGPLWTKCSVMDLFSKRTFSSHGSPLTVGVTFQPFFSHGTPLFSHGTFFCHFQPRDTHGTRRTFVYVHVGARGALSMGSRAVVVHGHGSPVLLVPAVRSPQAVVRRKSVTRLLLRFVGDEPILGPQGGSRNDDFFGKNHLTW